MTAVLRWLAIRALWPLLIRIGMALETDDTEEETL